jgi:FGGY-family pentulose kinase
MSPDPVFVPGVWGPYRDTIFPGCWMAEGGQSATGQLLKHVLETHPAFERAQTSAKHRGLEIFGFLNTRLEELAVERKVSCVADLARHFFFYGDLFGNRSPLADSKMAGSVVGQSSDISIEGLAIQYYGTLEFIALQTKQIVHTMNEAGHNIRSIFMSGSQCQNEILVNLIASACNMPVVVPRYINAAVCHGAAMLGVKAASVNDDGHTVDLWDVIDRMSQP